MNPNIFPCRKLFHCFKMNYKKLVFDASFITTGARSCYCAISKQKKIKFTAFILKWFSRTKVMNTSIKIFSVF